MKEYVKQFEKNSYVIVKNFIDNNLANIFYFHVMQNAKRALFIESEQGDGYDKKRYGEFTDTQAYGDFSMYGNPIFDDFAEVALDNMQLITGKELTCTYTYHRLYTTDTELTKHKDRASCEISTTLFLGSNMTNTDDKKWPMFVLSNGKEVRCDLDPGDMIVYRGCDIEHWREPFKGINHAQLFMHYNEKGGKYDIKYDGRPIMGLDSNYKAEIDKPVTDDENYKRVIF